MSNRSNWMKIHGEPDERGGFFLSFAEAGGEWFKDVWMDDVYAELDALAIHDEQIKKAAKDHAIFTVMLYDCSMVFVGAPEGEIYYPCVDCDVYLEYDEVEIFPGLI